MPFARYLKPFALFATIVICATLLSELLISTAPADNVLQQIAYINAVGLSLIASLLAAILAVILRK